MDNENNFDKTTMIFVTSVVASICALVTSVFTLVVNYQKSTESKTDSEKNEEHYFFEEETKADGTKLTKITYDRIGNEAHTASKLSQKMSADNDDDEENNPPPLDFTQVSQAQVQELIVENPQNTLEILDEQKSSLLGTLITES